MIKVSRLCFCVLLLQDLNKRYDSRRYDFDRVEPVLFAAAIHVPRQSKCEIRPPWKPSRVELNTFASVGKRFLVARSTFSALGALRYLALRVALVT